MKQRVQQKQYILTQHSTVRCIYDQVILSGQWTGTVNVTGQTLPASFVLNVTYGGVSPEQINALAQISGFCWQVCMFSNMDTVYVFVLHSLYSSFLKYTMRDVLLF